jgi:hypothetical protein
MRQVDKIRLFRRVVISIGFSLIVISFLLFLSLVHL